VLGQFKSDRPPGLSLTHRRSINCVTVGSNVFYLNCDDVAIVSSDGGVIFLICDGGYFGGNRAAINLSQLKPMQ
jgi:hypothetical protein